MNINDVDGLPPGTADLFEAAGMEELYPPQAAAVDAGVTAGENVVASVPTASGKTLIAELAMLSAIHRGGTALYIVPLRALAAEKRAEFERFEPLGIDVGVSTGDYDSTDEWLAAKDIIVATSEKVDSLIRNGASWIDDLTCVVADEIHLVDDPSRGPTLEVTLAKLRRHTSVQLVALSATIGNAHEIANWLSANLVDSTWRPVELRRGVHYGNAITYADGTQYELDTTHDKPTAAIVADTVANDGSTLVFVNSRRNAEAAARRLASVTEPFLTEGERNTLDEVAEAIEAVSDTDTSRDLAATVRHGTAFHHAGLHADHRSLVEDAFRDRDLKAVCATPTLAAGVNTPSRRVIVRDWRRYDAQRGGMAPLDVLEVHQMFGRAGRPGLDPYGEAILLAGDHDEYDDLFERYINANPEPVRSKLATEPALRTHVLATIASGFATTRDALLEFLDDTLYATQTTDPARLTEVVNAILDYLAHNDFIHRGDYLEPTQIGRVVSWLYLDPMSAAEIIDGLRDATDPTPLGLYHLVSRTPDMYDLYLRTGDNETYTEIAYERADEFLGRMPSEFENTWDDWLSALKTARLIEDWANEVDEDRITNRYGVGPGDIRAKVDTAEWLLNATERLAEERDHDALPAIRSARQRIEHGVKAELLDLVGVRGVGRVRARKLYDAGIETRDSLREADKTVVLRALDGQRKTTENILRNAGRPDPSIEDTRVTVESHSVEDPEPAEDRQSGLGDFS